MLGFIPLQGSLGRLPDCSQGVRKPQNFNPSGGRNKEAGGEGRRRRSSQLCSQTRLITKWTIARTQPWWWWRWWCYLGVLHVTQRSFEYPFEFQGKITCRVGYNCTWATWWGQDVWLHAAYDVKFVLYGNRNWPHRGFIT